MSGTVVHEMGPPVSQAGSSILRRQSEIKVLLLLRVLDAKKRVNFLTRKSLVQLQIQLLRVTDAFGLPCDLKSEFFGERNCLDRAHRRLLQYQSFNGISNVFGR